MLGTLDCPSPASGGFCILLLTLLGAFQVSSKGHSTASVFRVFFKSFWSFSSFSCDSTVFAAHALVTGGVLQPRIDCSPTEDGNPNQGERARSQSKQCHTCIHGSSLPFSPFPFLPLSVSPSAPICGASPRTKAVPFPSHELDCFTVLFLSLSILQALSPPMIFSTNHLRCLSLLPLRNRNAQAFLFFFLFLHEVNGPKTRNLQL